MRPAPFFPLRLPVSPLVMGAQGGASLLWLALLWTTGGAQGAPESEHREALPEPAVVIRFESERPCLKVWVDGEIYLTKTPTRFAVIEWQQGGRGSGRVTAQLVSDPPQVTAHSADFRGRGTAPGTSDPLFEWHERWILTNRGFLVEMTLRNVSHEAVPVLFYQTGNVVVSCPHPILVQDRFQDIAFLDHGSVALIVEGRFDNGYREDRTGAWLIPLHGNLTLTPGGEASHHVHFRLVPGSRYDTSLSSETIFRARYQRLAEQFPRLLHWPDRRPILAVMTAASSRGYRLGYSTNPRGYQAADDVTIPEGLSRFREQKLQEARSLAATCRRFNFQGVILWDLEGQEFRHPVTYIGSPDRLLLQAPEMDEVADDYFAIFEEAGVRAGVCVRPQQLRLRPGRPPHLDPSNQFDWRRGGAPKYEQDGTYASPGGAFDELRVLELLADKIGYAYHRWKATLFYMDSPVNLSPSLLTELARRFPDCLLIPEFSDPTWYGSAAPLHAVPLHARRIWPDAFGCLGLDFAGDRPDPAEVRTAVEQGTILIGPTAASLAAVIAPHTISQWHDPAGFRWQDNQPVSRRLTERWLSGLPMETAP